MILDIIKLILLILNVFVNSNKILNVFVNSNEILNVFINFKY